MADFFRLVCALFFMEASGCFAFMLAYMIKIVPKSLMAVPIQATQIIMSCFALCCAALCVLQGPTAKALFPIIAIEKRGPMMWMLFLFHVTFGTFIISDSLFGAENPPKTYSDQTANQIASTLHNLMISSAAIQAGGAVVAVMAQFVKA